MPRRLPPLPTHHKRQSCSSTERPPAKKAKVADDQSPSKCNVLHDQRVLLVPLGADVSRKRLLVWQEIVTALGGSLIETPAPSPERNGVECYLHLQQSTQRRSRQPPSRRTSLERQSSAIAWDQVDVVIASTRVDGARLETFLQRDQLQSQTKIFAPEWLTYLQKHKRRPENEDEYLWNRQRHTDEDAHGALAPALQTRQAEDAAVESDGEGDGSDRLKDSSREIVRAPPVRVDEERIRKEEEELEVKKAKLVNERIPIFHKLNPHFKSIADAAEGKPLKTEAFVCQKSSCKCAVCDCRAS
ncbi:hypothetical protein PINS_up008727 [Pythium insidiosum]|nr:hypothetical protein PINS_up008727 [Pythium insidiosum]